VLVGARDPREIATAVADTDRPIPPELWPEIHEARLRQGLSASKVAASVAARPPSPTAAGITIAVDAHHHVWDPASAHYPWLTPDLAAINRAFTTDDLAEALHTTDDVVRATIVVQTRSSEDETRQLLALPRDTPVAGVVGWVDLTAPDVAERIAALREAPGGDGLVGFRHQTHDEADPNWLDLADVRCGLRAVADAGLAFDLLVRARELPAAIRLAVDLPDLRLVLDHLAKPPLTEPPSAEPPGAKPPGGEAMGAWADGVRDLARCENVVAKVSGLVTEANWHTWDVSTLQPAVDVALDTFGPDRLLWGSDWPVCLLAASYDRWFRTALTLFAQCSDHDRRSIFLHNATSTYSGFGLPIASKLRRTGDQNPKSKEQT